MARPKAARAERRASTLDPVGVVHDLGAIAEAERARAFPDVAPIPIGWGRGTRGRRLRSIRLASYEPTAQVIRVHPRLDDARVPAWFLGVVVFHEYLHHVLGVLPERAGDRWRMHTREFKRREAEHPLHGEAARWEAAHVAAIVSEAW
ncbi:MAG: hypothetical protein IT385_29470 [Deltaproteobacteria bacterium]|nr:hypothetical protein [Deltaproteobacteria bacterium]